MPNLTLSGVVLGLQTKPYDFKNADGERVAGESHTLFLWDDANVEPVSVKVPQDRMGLVSDLGAGEVVRLSVTISANNSRASFRFDRLLDAA